MPNDPNRNSNWARFIQILGDRWAVIRAIIPIDSELNEIFTEDNPGEVNIANTPVDVSVVGGSGVAHRDDSPFAVGVDDVTPMGALFDDVAPDAVNEDDVGAPRMAENRVLYSMIRDGGGAERGAAVSADLGLDTDTLMLTAPVWATLISNIRIDDDPTSFNSTVLEVTGYNAVWVLIDIDSALAPTHLRVLAQFSDDGGTTWWDFEEGLWASLGWEDTDTVVGINKAFMLPCGGIELIRFRIIGTGTDATNFFAVTLIARAFRGNFAAAHA